MDSLLIGSNPNISINLMYCDNRAGIPEIGQNVQSRLRSKYIPEQIQIGNASPAD